MCRLSPHTQHTCAFISQLGKNQISESNRRRKGEDYGKWRSLAGSMLRWNHFYFNGTRLRKHWDAWKHCTQCSCAAGAINPAVELSGHQCRTDVLSEFAGSRGRLWHIAPTMEEALKQKCDYWVCWASTSLVTLLKDKALDCVSSLIWSRRGFIPEPGRSASEWHRAVLVRTSLPRQV